MVQLVTKGIILSGGKGTRLGEATRAVSKQLLPVYDKPMVYYPLSYLIDCGVQDVLLITSPEDMLQYERLLSTGKQFGINIDYAIQPEPKGLAQAYIIAERWLKGCARSVMALGDNIFYGEGWDTLARDSADRGVIDSCKGLIPAYAVNDPRAYGVVEIDKTYYSSYGDGYAVSIQEKPSEPRSKLAVPGLYWFDSEASAYAKEIVPSARGELEITALIQAYIERIGVVVREIKNSNFWFDAGTPDGLLDAANFVASAQRRIGRKIGCPFASAKARGLI